MNTGHIFDIQRFSIHDGPGIRTTVFFKGCPLRCLWCGNPESIPREPSLSYIADKCIACGDCFDKCPHDALSASTTPSGLQGKAVVDRERCTGCGKCTEVCHPQALESVGRVMTANEVMEVVLRDADYYQASGGGLTLSGGEPLMQPEFAETLLRQAKARRLHTAVETSGFAMWGALRPLVPLVDLWLYDYKETDPQLHEKYVGKPLEPILANLKHLYQQNANILLRCPLIPHHNARRQHLDGIVALAAEMPKLQGVELLPYYDLWRAKLDRFGLTTDLPTTVKPPGRDVVREWKDYLRMREVPLVG